MKKSTMAAVSLLAVSAVSAATGDWQLRDGVGTSPETAAVWTDPANWKNGAVPTENSDGAYITNALVAPLFVKADTPLSVSWLQGVGGMTKDSTAVPFLVSDTVVTLNSGNRNPFFSGLRLYADLDAPHATGNAHFNSGTVCGDITMGFMTVASGTLYHRLDLYANQAGETRENPLSVDNYRNSWGAFRVYAPHGSSADVTGNWLQTAGSPYLRRAGAAHVLSAGTFVRGAGIKEGTYLKRVFTDGLIELSEPAETTVDGDGNVLTFDAFTCDVTLRIGAIARQNTSTVNMRLMKYREEDSLRCRLNSIYGGTSNIAVFDTDAGFVPGTFVVSRITDSTLPRLRFGDCHFEFIASEAGESGFPGAGARMIGADDRARVTVRSGVMARIASVTNLVGTFVKDGAGTLTTSINDLTGLNTGTLEVREGVLALDGTADLPPAYVAEIAVSSGATLKLPPNGLKVGSCELEPGSVIAGDGALMMAEMPDMDGVIVTGGATVGVEGGSGEVLLEPPAAGVPGVPAFWVDVSDTDTVTVEAENGTNFVTKLIDVRGESHGFATNVVKRPWLVTDGAGSRHIYFKQTSDAGIENGYPLVWDKFVYGIRHVFLVHCPSTGGGEILGVSESLWKKHYQAPFLRDAGATWADDIVWGGGMSAVVNGRFLLNGEECTYDRGYLYSGSYTYGSSTYYIPVVTEVNPLSGVHADAFGYDASNASRNGRHRLCECIVYTNELTKAARLAVTGYLMKKWIDAELDFEKHVERNPFGTAGFADEVRGYDVADGENGWLDGVAGTGTLVKSGDGTLSVPEFSNTSLGIRVKGGTLKIASSRLTRETLPEGAYLHLDASEASTVATNVVDGVARVTAWTGIDDDATTLTAVSASTNKPVYLPTACNGKPAVDFGPRQVIRYFTNASPDLRLPADKVKRAAVRTVFAVMDSSKGGGSLIPTCGYAYNVCFGIMRGDFGTNSASDVLIGSGLGATGNQVDNGEGTGITRARVNGVYIKPKSTGLSGGWDIVSLANHYALGVAGLGSDHYGWHAGGQCFAEYILYPQMLSRSTVEAVEAYLREKWFGVETEGFLPTRAKSVTVDAGATLALAGGPVNTSALSGTGTVDGGVVLSAGAEWTVVIGEDGTIDALTVSGALDLSAGGTLCVTGAVGRLKTGRYVIAYADAVKSAPPGSWFCAFDGAAAYSGKLVAKDGVLTLNVTEGGLTVIVR